MAHRKHQALKGHRRKSWLRDIDNIKRMLRTGKMDLKKALNILYRRGFSNAGLAKHLAMSVSEVQLVRIGFLQQGEKKIKDLFRSILRAHVNQVPLGLQLTYDRKK